MNEISSRDGNDDGGGDGGGGGGGGSSITSSNRIKCYLFKSKCEMKNQQVCDVCARAPFKGTNDQHVNCVSLFFWQNDVRMYASHLHCIKYEHLSSINRASRAVAISEYHTAKTVKIYTKPTIYDYIMSTCITLNLPIILWLFFSSFFHSFIHSFDRSFIQTLILAAITHTHSYTRKIEIIRK